MPHVDFDDVGALLEACQEGPLARDHHVGIFQFAKLLSAASLGRDAVGDLDEWEREAVANALGHDVPPSPHPMIDPASVQLEALNIMDTIRLVANSGGD
jgi:hypothetical protein